MTGGGGPRSSATRPRFIIVVWGVVPGGTLSVLREWVPRLQRDGSVSVVSLGPNRASLGVPTVAIGRRGSHPFRFPQVIGYVARMAAASRRAARGAGPAILIPQDSLATGAAALLAARLSGSRLAVMEHGAAEAIGTERFWRERYPAVGFAGGIRQRLLRRLLGGMGRRVVRRTDVALIAGDEAEATYRALGIDPGRIIRYRFAVDLDRFHPPGASERAEARRRWDLDPDAAVIATVGRLTVEKGVDDILAVAADHPHAALLVAGDGPLRAALERGAPPNARFLGRLEPDEVASLHRAADLFVYAGRQGANTPYAVLEAMASGLAVIATTAPEAHRAMLADGRGIAVEPDDRAAISEAIRRLLADGALRSRMGLAARGYVEAHHAPEILDEIVEGFVARVTRVTR